MPTHLDYWSGILLAAKDISTLGAEVLGRTLEIVRSTMQRLATVDGTDASAAGADFSQQIEDLAAELGTRYGIEKRHADAAVSDALGRAAKLLQAGNSAIGRL